LCSCLYFNVFAFGSLQSLIIKLYLEDATVTHINCINCTCFHLFPKLRYYEQQQDDSSKDIIDLKDVVAVTAIKNVQGAPKKADENAFFEVNF